MLAEDKDIEAVVIALPLHLHAPVAIDVPCKAGKHVLCEKLMAWNIAQCKEMIQGRRGDEPLLAIGHQRHYSMLYAHAVEVVKSGVLGDVKHIRALWHRNNSLAGPGTDDKESAARTPRPRVDRYRDSWRPADRPEGPRGPAQDRIKDLATRAWRSWSAGGSINRTGGGLMAELGSHQLDACSIFLGKVQPLAVTGVGGKYFYQGRPRGRRSRLRHLRVPRQELLRRPDAKRDVKDKNDIVVVTYSSISTNDFEPYGECVMGTRGTLIVEEEQNAYLFPERGGRSDGGWRQHRAAASRCSMRPPPHGPGRAGPRGCRPGRRSAVRSAAATARRWSTSPTASACGDGRLGEGKGGTARCSRAATAGWRWPTPSSP